MLDERTQLHKIDGLWFRVEFAPLPPRRRVVRNVRGERREYWVADAVYDVLRKRMVARGGRGSIECEGLYGMGNCYAVHKRQISRKEMKEAGVD